MTFLAAQSIQQLDGPQSLPTPSQRGRASIQFLGSAQRYSAGTLRLLARRIAERSPSYRMERFLQRVVAEEVYLRGVPAVEERRPEFERYLHAPLPDTPGSLELDPGLAVPDYYDGVEWHLQVGGWDGYDLYGPLFALVGSDISPLLLRMGHATAKRLGERGYPWITRGRRPA
jgi:hypothetical protein